jgi:archaeal flagellin FlaB
MITTQNSSDAFTGLEAAIVLIAFVVVVAVFSYVILGAGFFTTQKAQEAVYESVEQTMTNIQMIGNVYGIATAPSSGIDEIKLSIGVSPGGPATNLEKLDIAFSTPNTIPIILKRGNNTSTSEFTAKFNALTHVTTMQKNDQVEINFRVAPIPKDTVLNIEIRPGVGAALPFSKTTPTITTTNMLSKKDSF